MLREAVRSGRLDSSKLRDKVTARSGGIMGMISSVPALLSLVLSTTAAVQQGKFRPNGLPMVARQPEHRILLDARTKAPIPTRSSKVLSRLGKPLKSAILDQATGTIIRGP